MGFIFKESFHWGSERRNAGANTRIERKEKGGKEVKKKPQTGSPQMSWTKMKIMNYQSALGFCGKVLATGTGEGD